MKIKKEYLVQEIASEYIVVVPGEIGADMTRVISLNPTSAYLWQELSQRDFQVQDIAQLLCQRYAVDPQTALSDAQKWIESLEQCDALEA